MGRAFERLVDAAGMLAGIAIVAMMVVISIDVAARYLLNAPTAWALEITSYLMVGSVFLGAAHTLKEGGHINVDVAVKRLPAAARLVLHLACLLAVLVFSLFILWQGLAQMAYLLRVHLTSLQLETPMAAPYSVIPLGAALLALQVVVEIGKVLHGAPEGPSRVRAGDGR